MNKERSLIVLSMFLVVLLAVIGCSSDDEKELTTTDGQGALKVKLEREASKEVLTQAVEGDLMSKIAIDQVNLTAYEASDYDDNGSSAEVVDTIEKSVEGLDNLGTYALAVPNDTDTDYKYKVVAKLSGTVDNEEVSVIYHGSKAIGPLDDFTTASVTVPVSLESAKQLDVKIKGLPSKVGGTKVASMEVNLNNPAGTDIIKNINTAETVTFTDESLLKPSVVQVNVQLKDSQGSDIISAGEFGGEILLLPKQSHSLEVNQQPYLEVANQTIDEKSTLEFTVEAVDPEGDNITDLDVNNEPSGATFTSNGTTGTFSWTPGYDQAGDYNLTFIASSDKGGTNSQQVIIKVNNVNRVPSIDSITNTSNGSASIVEGQELSLTVNASDPDSGDSLTYSISGDNAAKFSQLENTFTWTPSAADYSTDNTFNITLEASDGTDTAAKDVEVIVEDDLTGPTVNDSTLTIANETSSSVDLSWTKATDNTYSQANLEYLVYYSTSNNISTVADCESNGTAFGNYNTDINTKTVTDLSAETTYYFNVVVRDIAGNKSIYTQKTTTTKPLDSEAPTLGNSGTINTTAVQSNSVTLDWVKGSDNLSSDENLEYKVVYSTANNISTVDDIENNNGTIAQDWTTNINNITLTGLDVNVEYYFNVVVKDEAQNKAVYNMTSAQTRKSWNPVGNEVTSSESFAIDMAFNSEDIPYVVYYIESVDRFGDDIREVKVKKFEDGSWQLVGSSGFVQDVRYLSIEIGSDDIPYVGYSHFGNADSNIVGVYKFENNSWQRLGALNFGRNIKEFGMALDSNNHPYIAYARSYYEYDEKYEDGYAYLKDTEVRRYDGNSWTKIGDSLLDGVGNYDGVFVNILDITFDSTDTPYVFFWDTNEQSYMVKKFDSTWQQVGDKITPSNIIDFSIKFDSVDTAYISYLIDGSAGDNEAVVKKYSGGSWQEVSRPSSSDVSGLDLSFDSENIPYVFYYSNTESNVEVKKFVDNSWQLLGKSMEGWDGDLAIRFNSNDVPYIFYEKDSYSSGERSYQSMVKKLE